MPTIRPRHAGTAVPGGEPAVGTRLSEREIHDNVLAAAEEELERPVSELFLSALEAGMLIGFSFLAAGFLAELAPPPLRRAAVAAGYPLGFVLVVIARAQLFTENTLEPVIPLLNHRDRRTLARVLRLWGVVLPGNLLGTFVVAALIAWTPMVEHPGAGTLAWVAERATAGGFWTVSYRAVFAGWLVALMAWLIASTRATGAQIVLIWLTTAPIAAFGFRHSIAGATEAFHRAASGAAPWGDMLGTFLVPAVLGNVVGGVGLVALLNWGQVGRWHGAGWRPR
jgi:formate/nitrite transporter FocA (FNT family)